MTTLNGRPTNFFPTCHNKRYDSFENLNEHVISRTVPIFCFLSTQMIANISRIPLSRNEEKNTTKNLLQGAVLHKPEKFGTSLYFLGVFTLSFSSYRPNA